MSSSCATVAAPADLAPGQVQIWLADPGLLGHAQLETRHLQVLDDAERARHQAFRFAPDRHIFLAAHALARHVLAGLTGLAPERIVFQHDASGKPRAVLPPGCGEIGYNLSHTSGLVACVLARGMACGVDVEVRRPLNDMMAIARTVFSASEAAALAACPEQQRETRFFTLWTLKEAYGKATGDGILGELSHLSFDLGGAGAGAVAAPTARFDTEHAGGAQGWRFYSAAAGERHLLAAAVRPSGHEAASAAAGLPVSFVQHQFRL